MSYTKTDAYNLALNALLLNKQLDNADTDTGSEARAFNSVWDTVFNHVLQDLDLDSLASFKALELIEEVDRDTYLWTYAYKYPSNCAFLRRIKSPEKIDNEATHIPKRVGIYGSRKVIFTDQYDAVCEYIPNDISLEFFSAPAMKALSYALASFTTPLIVGKGSKTLKDQIDAKYLIAKHEAQEADRLENFVFDQPEQRSEFARVRLS